MISELKRIFSSPDFSRVELAGRSIDWRADSPYGVLRVTE